MLIDHKFISSLFKCDSKHFFMFDRSRYIIRIDLDHVEHFEAPAEISVTFVDNAAIAELNNQYRNKPMPTDVLSFPLGVDGKYDVDENNGCKMLGDIVISMERAQEQANLYGHPLQREVAFLTVHSMLHLLGYDHENGGLEAMRMREKEEAVLLQLGLPRTVSYTE